MATADISRRLTRLALSSHRHPTLSHSSSVSRASHNRYMSASSHRAAEAQEPIHAAPVIDFDNFKPPPAGSKAVDVDRLRIVPASPSYFSARPKFTDDYLRLRQLLAKWQSLPASRPQDVPRATWLTAEKYISRINEPVRPTRYTRLVRILDRLNLIVPTLVPEEVKSELSKFRRDVDPSRNQARPILLDEHGRARAIGRRKESSAIVWLVEGDGEVIINGKKLHDAFPRQHDRESVVWPLKATQRLDKYNIFGNVRGGGTTGQAEAMTLGVAKALMAHEPEIKTYLRKAGVVTRDPRMVERKKPGRVKARKMPTWVKR